MFARIKKSGQNQYLQIVENRREAGKVLQRVVATVGRLDRLQQKGDITHRPRGRRSKACPPQAWLCWL